MATPAADRPVGGEVPTAGVIAGRPAGTLASTGGGLRERKKRAMRQQLSDTAARMFLERGFDAVRVAEVAEACGVSEKTVFNYFPTKERLLFDRLEATADALGTVLADTDLTPLEGMLHMLQRERQGIAAGLAAGPDPDQAISDYLKFGDLIRATPSLRNHQGEVVNQLADLAAHVLAARAGAPPDAPEARIVATALLGLWRIQLDALRTHLHPGRPIPEAIDAVTEDVRRAALVLHHGLAGFVTADTSRADRPAGEQPKPAR
jgi:AcrR family transcriptional regulator